MSEPLAQSSPLKTRVIVRTSSEAVGTREPLDVVLVSGSDGAGQDTVAREIVDRLTRAIARFEMHGNVGILPADVQLERHLAAAGSSS